MIKPECETCEHHKAPDWCLSIASGMGCKYVTPGETLRISDELLRESVRHVGWSGYKPGQGVIAPFAKSGKAKDTQVAGDHYKKMGVEPWDVVDTWPLEQRIGAYRHGALKYLMRMGSKDQNAQEIAKGKHYMEKLLEVLNEKEPK